ncbi:alpha/beta hydrolase [Streptosporangium sp. NPDC051023]|uniref:alpha/beta hydrolase family protein n=1 Tax=Streptosporangium sp. NPDC051023 TaxID=3155410 RepID=UPI00344B6DC8
MTERENTVERYGAAVAPPSASGNGGATRPGGGRPRVRGPILRGALAAAVGLLALAASASPASAAPTPTPASSASAVPSPAPTSASSASPTLVPPVPPAPATPTGAASLPAPTGSHPVGATFLYLKDTSRPDPWVPTVKARELMVSLWYPAKSPGGRRAPYMTPQESEALLKGEGITNLPLDILSKTRTNAFLDAKPAGRKHSLPLVVLSPGFTRSRKTLTGLAEELASRGYVVAGIDHTYESRGTSFPDGRVAPCAACEVDDQEGFHEKAVDGRAADVSFVLDELTGPHSKWKGASLIDRSRIGMSGQSIGGASSVAAMLKDDRIRAGINADGTTHAPIPQSGLARPFMFLGNQERHSPGGGDTSWDRDWKLLTGWKRWLVVAGAAHASFTDLPLLADQLGVPHGAEISGARSLEITGQYVHAFFDLHLRGERQPLLDGPSARYPEVKHCSVDTKTCQ